MRRLVFCTLTLMLAAVPLASGGTFSRSPILPGLGIDALTRDVTREQLGRELFANPYATVTIARMDVYDVFPYVESRTFQVVADPQWNRLVFGDPERNLRAFDGKNTTFGALSAPRGMAADDASRVYVADSGNDRILVFQAVTEFDAIDLVPVYEIRGLSQPHDVAFSDGGTPFRPGDDFLYVADAGKNRVMAFSVDGNGARQVAALGELGSGRGRFAGPIAIASGRRGDANTNDVYVADAHTRRLVHLRHDASGLAWVEEAKHDAEVLTSLDVDQWGNLYAAAPQQGVVRKFAANLAPVAELRGGLSRPRSFHVPFLDVYDHRNGTVRRVGQPNGVSVEQWANDSGIRLWTLGVEIAGLGVAGPGEPAAHFTLTDRATVTLQIADASNGRSIASRTVGPLEAGLQQVSIADQLRGVSGSSELMLRVSAASSYPGGATDVAQTTFRMDGGVVGSAPRQAVLLGNWPNPAVASTRIAFLLPEAAAEVTVRVFDASGRLVRKLDRGFSPGWNEVLWDGANDRGSAVPAGVYFYRLTVDGTRFTRRLVLVR